MWAKAKGWSRSVRKGAPLELWGRSAAAYPPITLMAAIAVAAGLGPFVYSSRAQAKTIVVSRAGDTSNLIISIFAAAAASSQYRQELK